MFLPMKNADGAPAPFEYLPCGAIQPKYGMALIQSSGKLAIATGSNEPKYISMYEAPAVLTAGTIIPVIRVDHDTIYETTLSASGTSLKLGDKVTLHASDGMQITATKVDSSSNPIGVAEIVYMDGTAVGSMARVRF